MTLATLTPLLLMLETEPEAAHQGGLLDPHVGLIVWTLVTFLLLLFALSRLAWKPMLAALNSREESIQTAIERSEQARAEAERLLAQNQALLAEAEGTRQRMLREATDDVKAVREREIAALQTELGRQREQARLEIEREKDAALVSLRAEVADLAVRATEKLIEANLDAGRAERLVDSVIADLNQNTPARLSA